MKTIIENKVGYKKTKVGWIPKDWHCRKLEDISDFITKGATPTTYGFEWVEDGVLFLRSECASENGLNLNAAKFISEAANLKMTRSEISYGDILMTITGNVGRVIKVPIEVHKANINQHIARIRINNDSVNRDYTFQSLCQETYSREYRRIVTGQAYPQLSLKQVRNIYVAFPCLTEQQKISQILSRWDEAITNTQNLIAKLKLRKKGLMQQLLIGKKRLSGFDGEWELLKGKELFSNQSNKGHNGELEVLSATQDKGVIPRAETGIDIKYDKSSLTNYKKVEVGDFVISLRSFQGGIEYSNYEGLVSPAYTVLKEIRPISKLFYREYLKTKDFINRLNSIIYGIRDGKQISYKEFGTLKLHYPPLEEQEAIAQIISSADNEINENENKLTKLEEQKKGLMQQLLTGQKRVKYE